MVRINKFEKPRIPNFIKTDSGLFDLGLLEPNEINRYINVWKVELLNNWQKRKKEVQKDYEK